MSANNKGMSGFTLIELIVVIAILAILAGVAIPAYAGYIKKAQEVYDIQAISNVKTAADAAIASYSDVDVSFDVGARNEIQVIFSGENAEEAANDYEMYLGDNRNHLIYYGDVEVNDGILTGVETN